MIEPSLKGKFPPIGSKVASKRCGKILKALYEELPYEVVYPFRNRKKVRNSAILMFLVERECYNWLTVLTLPTLDSIIVQRLTKSG